MDLFVDRPGKRHYGPSPAAELLHHSVPEKECLSEVLSQFLWQLGFSIFTLVIYKDTAANFWMPHHLLSNNSLSSVYETSVKKFNNFN